MGQFLRAALVLVALSAAACAGPELAPFGAVTPAQQLIDNAFADRNACLASNASYSNGGSSDEAAKARAVVAACQSQIDQLIMVSNPHRDPKITASIRQDSEFRALGYVSRVRGSVARS